MKIVKYDKARNTSSTANGSTSSGGGSSTTIEGGGGSVDLDRTIWGKHDTGDDIDGHLTCNGDITIKAIIPPIYDDDDDDEYSGDTVEYDEGGGNLNVELKTTTKDLDVTNNAYVKNHLYINYNKNHSHSTNKKCIGEILNSVETDVDTNKTDISNLKTRVSTNESNIASNLSEINNLKTRLTTDETNINKNKTDIATNKTNINQLDRRVQELENRKQAGYYWSAEANMSGSTPISPIEPVTFVGTDIGSFEVTVEQPYLWRTTDGSSWVLVQCYLPPQPEKYYVCSNFNGSYMLSSGQVYNFPGGFVAFYEQIGSEIKLITPYGLSNWCNYTTQQQQSTGSPTPTLNYPNGMSNIARGYIPRVEGYVYVYTIDDLADINNYQKWTLVQSGSSGGSSFTHFIEYDDWGNASVSPGYNIFTVDTTTHLVGSKPLGQNADDPYIGAQGSTDRWKNETWRKSFVMHILSGFLYKNRGYYNSRLGWAFNYNGAASCVGYAGMWTCRMGGINAPTSNNPNDIGYYCTSSIPYLTGYVYSTSAEGMPFKVEFRFLNIKLGKLTNYKPLGAAYANTIDKSLTPYKYWDVEIGDCTYKTS